MSPNVTKKKVRMASSGDSTTNAPILCGSLWYLSIGGTYPTGRSLSDDVPSRHVCLPEINFDFDFLGMVVDRASNQQVNVHSENP